MKPLFWLMAVDTTVLIPAWNAEDTIERALLSIGKDVPVVLVDDFSTDETVIRAESVGLAGLKVVRPPEKRGLGLVRQTALDAVETPYAVWLDADDEFLPGRLERVIAPLRAGPCDFVSDAQELVDGTSGAFIKDLPIPEFISEDRDKVRLFERNWLPGIAHVAFRTDFARRVNYDTTLHGGDDSDFVSRAIAAGARFHFIHEKGYRMYAYPGSDSRKIEKQRSMVARALRKHAYSDIQDLYLQNGFGERVGLWGLVSLALFREEFAEAERYLKALEPLIDDPDEILEPQGPYPVPEGWRYTFSVGTLALLKGAYPDAVSPLECAEEMRKSAETLNNLGVAYRKSGEEGRALELFERAIALYPGYLDARLNLEDAGSVRITVHPLRMQASRDDY
ncbi:MAG: glycosyltransferase [Opitutales bacterium]